MTHAFKEWAVICAALAEGQQALILRKGGIQEGQPAENDDEFRLEHSRFWLYPTYTHQHHAGIRDEAVPLLKKAEADRPAAGIIRLSCFAEVTGVYIVNDLVRALLLAHLHFWSDETLRQRFAYRRPGLYVMPVRVYRLATVHEIPDLRAYHGCRSWVDLQQDLSSAGAVPVLSPEQMADLHRSLDLLLNPIATV